MQTQSSKKRKRTTVQQQPRTIQSKRPKQKQHVSHRSQSGEQQEQWIMTSYNLLSSQNKLPECLKKELQRNIKLRKYIEKVNKPIVTNDKILVDKVDNVFKFVQKIKPRYPSERLSQRQRCLIEGWIENVWKPFIQKGLSKQHFSNNDVIKAIETLSEKSRLTFDNLFTMYYMNGFHNKDGNPFIELPQRDINLFIDTSIDDYHADVMLKVLLLSRTKYEDSYFDLALNETSHDNLEKLKILAQLFPKNVNYNYVSNAYDYYYLSKTSYSKYKLKILEALMNYIRHHFHQQKIPSIKRKRQNQTATQKQQRQRKQKQKQKQLQAEIQQLDLQQPSHHAQQQRQQQKQLLQQQLKQLQRNKSPPRTAYQIQAQRRARQAANRRARQRTGYRSPQAPRIQWRDEQQLYAGSPRRAPRRQAQRQGSPRRRQSTRRRLNF